MTDKRACDSRNAPAGGSLEREADMTNTQTKMTDKEFEARFTSKIERVTEELKKTSGERDPVWSKECQVTEKGLAALLRGELSPEYELTMLVILAFPGVRNDVLKYACMTLERAVGVEGAIILMRRFETIRRQIGERTVH
jgi:hypothetical protein